MLCFILRARSCNCVAHKKSAVQVTALRNGVFILFIHVGREDSLFSKKRKAPLLVGGKVRGVCTDNTSNNRAPAQQLLEV